MKNEDQSLDAIVESLSPLAVDWMDDVAAAVIARLTALPKKASYGRSDIADLLEDGFDEGILCARLFLGLSKDAMEAELRRELGGGGVGVKRFERERDAFLDALQRLALDVAMTEAVGYQPIWSDILVERLRSGRGSAIQGQRRGRGLEDFVEAILVEVFGPDGFEVRCAFDGVRGRRAKCDFAVPDRIRPHIIIETKGYGATGSKMSDIIGDLDAIIEAKRHDQMLLFVTDGMTWKARLSDLRKIVERQNDGKIARIYTMRMRDQLVADLEALKARFSA
ncbi:DpnII family type II restriction endonuclease [Salinarimonas sp.]|uniref:DpnII family type II restriction endonuclease n=1 Tax=Salinarimonas sp. TaxID=2766526 RepID=UPI00391DEC8E